MRAVGEVMSIGKTFKEAFQKAIRSLETGRYGLGHAKDFDTLSKEELLEKWETEISSPIYAAKEGYVDYICQPHELRARLAAALNMLGMKAAF